MTQLNNNDNFSNIKFFRKILHASLLMHIDNIEKKDKLIEIVNNKLININNYFTMYESMFNNQLDYDNIYYSAHEFYQIDNYCHLQNIDEDHKANNIIEFVTCIKK